MAASAGTPRVVKVGPAKVSIEFNDDVKLLGEANGMCLFDEGRIVLHKNLSPGITKVTLWHEVKHYVWGILHLHEVLEKVPEGDREEFIIGITAALELQVLTDNPPLRKYLFE